MESSTMRLSVIYIFCSMFLTIPYESRHLENAATTAPPTTTNCYGNYAYDRKGGRNGIGASQYNSGNTVDKCATRCSELTSCTSFDFNIIQATCWIHTSNVENSLGVVGGIDHYQRIACPASSTIVTTGGTTAPIPFCVKGHHYDDYVDTHVIGGHHHKAATTLLKCLEFCSDSPETGTSACTAVDFTNKNQCFIHRTAANELDKRTSDPGKVTHYVKESCASSTAATTSPGTTIAAPNALVSFTALFTNDYDATIKDVDAFIDIFRARFCDDTGVRCARLLKPQMPADVIKVTTSQNPGPNKNSIRVEGMLAPAENNETNTEMVMTNFENNKFKNFRHRLGPQNGNVRLRPDTSESYEGFTWTRIKTTDPPPKPEDDGLLGLKTEYWILIGLALLALVVTVIAIVVICCLRRKNSESSDNAQKEREKKKAEQERKRKEKEEKKKAEQERKAREKKEKEQIKKEKKDRDVEKGEDTYSEPDVVPTNVDDTPSGLSDEDKAY